MHSKSVFCFAASRAQAGQIVDRLKAASFSSSDISALCADQLTSRDFANVKHAKAFEGAIAGLGIGGVLGWMAGIGVLVIPGFGPFIEASPILAGLSGVAMGAVVGGIVGGLIGMGIPARGVRTAEDKLQDGNIRISVNTENSSEITQAEIIFAYAGGKGICTTAIEAEAEDNRATEIIIYPVASGLVGTGPGKRI